MVAPLLVLDAILSGAKAPSFSRGVPVYQGTRLRHRLVEGGLASAVGSRFSLTAEPYLFEIWATVQHGHTHAAVERALVQEIARIQVEGVRADEVQRARQQMLAQGAYALERASEQAWLLGLWATLDQVEHLCAFHAALEAVTPGDVQRVAQTYLLALQRTVGWSVPTL